MAREKNPSALGAYRTITTTVVRRREDKKDAIKKTKQKTPTVSGQKP